MIGKRLSDLFGPLTDIILPRVCHVCGTTLPDGEEFLCTRCLSELPRTNFHRVVPNRIEVRLATLRSLRRATSWLLYDRDSATSRLVHDIKYRGFPHLGITLGRIMANELIATGFFSDVEMVAPVPLFTLRMLRRGFNQTEMLARGVAEVLGVPVVQPFRARFHRSQTHLTHEHRLTNVRDAYRLVNPDIIRGRHLLLLDDVCTTGATLLAIGKLTESLPSTRLSVLTLAAAGH